MPEQPKKCRAVAFFDTQNLYRCAKDRFGYSYPNFDPAKLAGLVCRKEGWELAQTRLYTGVPRLECDPFWHTFWSNKIAALKRRGVYCYRRDLAVRFNEVSMPDGSASKVQYFVEKGVDVRIAIDMITLGRKDVYDVALIFSQDQDLSEVAIELRAIAKEQNRRIKVACAFPDGSARGIDKTDWIRISRQDYDACIDPVDYRGSV